MAVNKLVEKIVYLMKKKSITKVDLAKAMKIDISIIEQWENGTARPLLTQIPDLAQALGVSVDELVIYSGEKKAIDLITQYGSLPNLINNNQKIAELESVLPFLESQTIKDLYMIIMKQSPRKYNIIVKLISHMDQKEIDEIANYALANDKELINKILPFVSESIIMNIIKNCDIYDFSNIKPYLPYINEKEAEKIAAKYVSKFGIDKITNFLPYVSKEFCSFIKNSHGGRCI